MREQTQKSSDFPKTTQLYVAELKPIPWTHQHCRQQSPPAPEAGGADTSASSSVERELTPTSRQSSLLCLRPGPKTPFLHSTNIYRGPTMSQAQGREAKGVQSSLRDGHSEFSPAPAAFQLWDPRPMVGSAPWRSFCSSTGERGSCLAPSQDACFYDLTSFHPAGTS